MTVGVKKEDLNEMLQIAIKQVEAVGVKTVGKIKPEVRTYPATSYFGQCRKKDNEYEITISSLHFKNGRRAVMETMAHEVLHTTSDTQGHCSRWKYYAHLINNRYGYNISRCGSWNNGMRLSAELPKRQDYKYIIECTECLQKSFRKSKSKIVRNPSDYLCGRCRGKLKIIKV